MKIKILKRLYTGKKHIEPSGEAVSIEKVGIDAGAAKKLIEIGAIEEVKNVTKG